MCEFVSANTLTIQINVIITGEAPLTWVFLVISVDHC